MTLPFSFSADSFSESNYALDALLLLLEAKRRTFDFAGRTRRGSVLLVGEGDLSFALALACAPRSRATNIVATTFESANQVSESASRNACELRKRGAKVLHGIDACRLDDQRLAKRYDTIGFQFPNTGTRRSVHGRTDNHVLVRRFLRAAKRHLMSLGNMTITIVNSPHHLGAFDLPQAADWAGCEVCDVLPFYRSAWKGYGHVNTNDEDESALSGYRSCSTWVFRPLDQS